MPFGVVCSGQFLAVMVIWSSRHVLVGCCYVVILFRFFYFIDTPPSEIYTLSLHDALPIYHARYALEALRRRELIADGLPVERTGAGDRLGEDAQGVVAESGVRVGIAAVAPADLADEARSEEHTSELQSRVDLVCRLLLEKK